MLYTALVSDQYPVVGDPSLGEHRKAPERCVAGKRSEYDHFGCMETLKPSLHFKLEPSSSPDWGGIGRFPLQLADLARWDFNPLATNRPEKHVVAVAKTTQNPGSDSEICRPVESDEPQHGS